MSDQSFGRERDVRDDLSSDIVLPPAWLNLLLQDADIDLFEAQDLAPPEPPINAIRVSTGVGKTRTVVEYFAKFGGPIAFFVPTHRLGDEIVREFARHGCRARVFRGRNSYEPSSRADKMCRDLRSVDLALEHGSPISETCCKGKKPDGQTAKCSFYDSCSYQLQFEDEPDVWVIPHQLLFHAQKALGSHGL